jgi:hypothetical protein
MTVAVATLVAVLLVGVTWSLARLSAPSAGALVAPTPTATPLQPTPTPHLVVGTPRVRVYAAWVQPEPSAPCDDCFGPNLTFTTDGPFDVLIVCNEEYSGFAGTPTFSYTLLDPNGTVVHQVEKNCGDPTKAVTVTSVTPEERPAGTYTLHGQFGGGPGAKASLVVLAASLVPDTGTTTG